MAEYLAELRRIAARCLFAREYLSKVLQDHFICGLCSKAMQKKLLSEDDIILQKAVEVAKSAKVANKHARALNMKTATSDLAVGAIEGSSHSTSRQASPPQGGRTGRTCYHCAKTGHFAHDCPYRDMVCHKCGKKGHLAKTCRGGGNPRVKLMWDAPTLWGALVVLISRTRRFLMRN